MDTLRLLTSKITFSGDHLYQGTPCWLWKLKVNPHSGYAFISINSERNYVHRLMYELLIGPIPPGLQVDHLCENKRCCNPAHLEPVTRLENVQRHFKRHPVNPPLEYCSKGHAFTPENTVTYKYRKRKRDCKLCKRARDVKAYLKRHGKAFEDFTPQQKSLSSVISEHDVYAEHPRLQLYRDVLEEAKTLRYTTMAANRGMPYTKLYTLVRKAREYAAAGKL